MTLDMKEATSHIYNKIGVKINTLDLNVEELLLLLKYEELIILCKSAMSIQHSIYSRRTVKRVCSSNLHISRNKQLGIFHFIYSCSRSDSAPELYIKTPMSNSGAM